MLDQLLSTWLGEIIAAVGGVFVGGALTLWWGWWMNRPKLIVTRGGIKRHGDVHSCNVNVRNEQSFFGMRIEGDTAKQLGAKLIIGKQKYDLYWVYHQTNPDLATGDREVLAVFYIKEASHSFHVRRHDGKILKEFENSLKCKLKFRDSFNRKTTVKLRITFEVRGPGDYPSLIIDPPIELAVRVGWLKAGLMNILSAFRLRP
ncbi:MAG: hypothetical protein NXH95_13765 [Pseudomonadaceae bacterium]|nr:hypothetical protein [Pseudomonadaceae bacterium]